MKIEVLYVPHCPNLAATLQELRHVLAEEGVSAQVQEILVNSAEMAESRRFPGSPTIRIDGQDIEPQDARAQTFGLLCRLDAEQGQGVSREHLLRAAIRKSACKGHGDE